MFVYKDISFYEDYCSRLDDFVLAEPFVKKDNEFVGMIMPKQSIYKMEIVVTIPETFPHNKLIFSTTSLYGYPHLIPYRERGKRGSWFCLNSAFAETAEAQLDEEFNRLRVWMRKQMREDLPPHITDGNAIRALQVFNAYEGENPDELNELRERNSFVFVGDFAKDPSKFEKSGNLFAVKHLSGIFTIFEDEEGTNTKLPYVIVDHIPNNSHLLSSWIQEFHWDEKMLKHLFPDIRLGVSSHMFQCKNFLALIKEGESMLINSLANIKESAKNIDFSQDHKRMFEKDLSTFIEDEKRSLENMKRSFEQDDDEPDPAELYYHDQYKYRYFAVGVKRNDKLSWILCPINKAMLKEVKTEYPLGDWVYEIKTNEDLELSFITSHTIISYDDYFGRGCLCNNLTSKRIAIIGLGAIGSSMAEALVRGGVNELTLWDGDIVEAGNICRSSYDNTAIGDAKARALSKRLTRISPFCKINVEGYWSDSGTCTEICKYIKGDFYANINYDGQEKFISSLDKYDLMIDCTASNELLHFLSYAAKDKPLISLCITNHSKDFLCLSNTTGNVFELRKHYLSAIEQDTGNFYIEGTGCYAPTFLAAGCDIAALANLCVRTINRDFAHNKLASYIWHYNDNGIASEVLLTYRLENSPIRMTITSKLVEEICKLPKDITAPMGYLLGGFSRDKQDIYVTNLGGVDDIEQRLDYLSELSNGIVDYIGEISVCRNHDIPPYMHDCLKNRAEDENVNTNNPLLATLDAHNDVQFYLYADNTFIPFVKEESNERNDIERNSCCHQQKS